VIGNDRPALFVDARPSRFMKDGHLAPLIPA
jgi:hypothetical protein